MADKILVDCPKCGKQGLGHKSNKAGWCCECFRNYYRSEDQLNKRIKYGENARARAGYKEKFNEYQRKWREENKEEYKQFQIDAKNAKRKRMLDFKQSCINILGGKCSECGYDKCMKALDFHHIDPNHKEYTISKLMANGSKSAVDKIKEEIKKCVVLCKNCHTELHENSGTYGSYDKYF